MTSAFDSTDRLCINTIRTLAIDMIQKANSGHPGLPMGAAPMAWVLFSRHLKHNPADPSWSDRDRFVLSAGHGSALLYSLLHVTGYDLSMDDLKSFRQWGSKTPGHPESILTPGVEATTGPLGQGTSNAVGMAIAQAWMAARYNRDGHEIVDHYTYVLVSDGDMMEGICAEAASLAGHLGIGKLIFLYDSNDVSLDGPASWAFSNEDIIGRFKAYGWQTFRVEDGNEDLDGIDEAISRAKEDPSRSALIEIKTTIGYGSPEKAGKSDAHGAPLGEEEVVATKKKLGWDWPEKTFHIPDEALERFRRAVDTGRESQEKWRKLFDSYREKYPELAEEWRKSMEGELPDGWDDDLPEWEPGEKVATRSAAGKALNAIASKVPWLIGGDADLSSSTKTALDGRNSLADGDKSGEFHNIHYGVREHAMGGISNGMCYHRGVRPYAATFLVFSDYMRPSVRLAALSGLPVVYVWTHDSIAVGEDGPTHEPVEHVASLRAMPGIAVVRPADAAEAVEAWKWAMQQNNRPVALILTRQKLPVLDRSNFAGAENLSRGAYILSDAQNGKPQAIIIATGSEVHIAVEAQKMLAGEGIHVRVVSMPCREAFVEQNEEYRKSVLPDEISARISVEAGATLGWERWVGDGGMSIGIDRYGASAPGPVNMEKFGFTAERIADAVRSLVG